MWGVCSGSLVILPTAIFLLSLIKPCMPPGLVFEFYTWFVACGLIDFAILIMLIYPGEVKLLLLAVLMGNIIPVPVLIFFLAIAVDFWIIIHAVFKVLSYPYVESLEFIHLVNKGKCSKWEGRFIKSCPPSKLSLGDGGFFDTLTSLVIWQKCIDFLITFLLM
ncbi:hypothetical protein Fcan01_22435 [Folsomia candida]|uniref:Uncharacterized protein n=1 Tax=Folsomia candida TaxID=158441 RepID=A0A226DBJ2_FOLCA|nr:hypothetical protein Fcan01_22435 [Folsomia candida]